MIIQDLFGSGGPAHQQVEETRGRTERKNQGVAEGPVTSALIGGTLGALAAGDPSGAYVGAGIGMAADALLPGLKKKQKAAADTWQTSAADSATPADTYTDNVLDSKLNKQAWEDYIEDLMWETSHSLGVFSGDYRPGYRINNPDDPDSGYYDPRLWNRLWIIQTHFKDAIKEIARSEKTEAQKTKDYEYIGQRAAAEFQKYRKVGESVEQGVGEETQRLDPKCWTGYKKQGTKMKGGVRVNNCVPRESVEENTDPVKDPYTRGYFDALSLTKRSQSPYPPGSTEDRQYHAGFEEGYAERRDHYS